MRRLPNPFRDPVALAGWLFADFLLAAAVIFLATSPGATQPLPTPVPILGAAPTPTPTATPPPCLTAVSLKKIEFTVSASGGQDPTDAQLQQAFQQYAGQQAGIMLTFGHNASIPSAIGEATRINTRLKQSFPTLFPAAAIMENYYSGEPSTGDVNFILYLITSNC